MIYGGVASSELKFIRQTTSFSGTATFSGLGSLAVSGQLINPSLLQATALFGGAGTLGISAKLLMSASETLSGIGTMVADIGKAVATAFSASLGGPGAGIDGDSVRNVVPLGAFSGTEVRVTFKGQLNCVINNASIGVQSTTYNTGATPVELTFGGNHGYTVTANGQEWVSDWVSLTISPSDIVIVVQDYGASSNHYYAGGVSGTVQWRLDASASYSDASPAGSWSNDGNYTSVEKVEVR